MTLLGAHQHAIDDDDGVIHEHPQRNDQSTQGNTFQRHIPGTHEDKGAADGQRQHEADNEATAQSHERQQHDDDDNDGFHQAHEEAVDGGGYRIGLQRNDAKLDPQWRARRQLPHALVDGRTHGDDVAATHRGDAKTDGIVPVITQNPHRWIHVTAANSGHIPEVNLPLAGFADAAQQQIFEFPHRVEGAGWFDGDERIAYTDASRIGDQVFVTQTVDNLLGVDAELRHAIAVRFHVNGFGALTPQLDLRYIRHQQQFAAQKLGVFFEFRRRVLIAVYGEEDAENVAVVVIDDGRTGPRRQFALHVAYLTAQFVPHLRQRKFVVFVLDANRDRRQAAIGFRFHLFQLTELLNGLFDLVTDFFFHLFGGGAGVGRDDQRLFDGELGIFQSRQSVERDDAGADQHHGQDHGGGAVAQ